MFIRVFTLSISLPRVPFPGFHFIFACPLGVLFFLLEERFSWSFFSWSSVGNKSSFFHKISLFCIQGLRGFPSGSVVKNLPANAGDAGGLGSIPVSGRSPGVANGSLLQYSCLERSRDRGVWWVTVHMVAESRTWLRNYTHTHTHTHTHTGL